MSTRLYRLQGRTPVQCDLAQWGAAHFGGDNVETNTVADQMVGDIRVSTVFIGLDHNPLDGSPTLFETMSFDKNGTSIVCHRCPTWDEAALMHRVTVDVIQAEHKLGWQHGAMRG